MTTQHSNLRRLTAWIATLAILFGVFSPTVSHALAKSSGQDGQYLAVCTSTGIQYVKLDLDNSDGQPVDVHRVQSECAWCFSTLHAIGIPAVEHPHDFFIPGKSVTHSLDIASPDRRFSWPPSLARAPPPQSEVN